MCQINSSCVVSFVMTTRRDALTAALALLTEATVSAQNPTASNPSSVFVHDLPNLTMYDWQVTVSQIPFPPGRLGQTHHHAGFVLAYVLEGAIVTRISGQAERTYKTGEMFYEGLGATHEVSKNASSTEPAKLLALIFAKKGEILTTPGPASSAH
jgi:quercetin dioxygenase-like cupin family protein